MSAVAVVSPPRPSSLREGGEPTRTREVQTGATPLSPGQIKSSLAIAYQKLHGQSAPRELLDTLVAQVCTETASGARMHDYNFGGIKGQSSSGLTARVNTREILNGEEVRLKDSFRAYRTPVEGAIDYVAFLERRFPKAIEAAKNGDVDGYVGALKRGRYFTADETAYASAVRSHRDSTVRSIDPSEVRLPDAGGSAPLSIADELVLPPDGDFATTAAVTRVLDAMNASMVSLARSGEEDEG